MNKIRHLKTEVKALLELISGYDHDSIIISSINALEEAIENSEYDDIVYFMEKIVNWYTSNINEIKNNEFVFNSMDHVNMMKSLEARYKDLINNNQDYVGGNYTKEMGKEFNKKVFISHSSKDNLFGSALVKLLRGIGLNREQIIFTSDDKYGIPQGEDIFEYLKGQITMSTRMIFMLSDNYYKSIACLNEMGAAWVVGSNKTILFVPGFSPNDDKFYEGAINPRMIGFEMDNKTRLIEFKNIISEEFNLKVDEQDWENIKEEYLNKIRGLCLPLAEPMVNKVNRRKIYERNNN